MNACGGEMFFSHGTRLTKGVCTLIYPPVRDRVESFLSDKLGRIVLITLLLVKQITKPAYCREMEIRRQLDVLDDIICNNFHSSEIDLVLKEFEPQNRTSINL